MTEVLANPGVEVPATVRDAVLARLTGLSDETQRALELLSTVPGRVERWLVERLLGDRPRLARAYTNLVEGLYRRGCAGCSPARTPGVLATFGRSALGRLLARKGDPAAGALLEWAGRTAAGTNSVQAIALAGIARVEAAWLAGDHRAAADPDA